MSSVAVCAQSIDRHALVGRNNPHIAEINERSTLNVGNGRFSFGADATGLQTFPEYYSEGLTLGTFSEWGWHSFPNVNGYRIEETLRDTPLPGHEHGVYAVAFSDGPERNAAAAEWFRANPHRLHLGNFGFEGMEVSEISDISQTLDMWNGELHSDFRWNGSPVSVVTSCHGEKDIVSASISSAARPSVVLRFPYPTGVIADGASRWDTDERHLTEIVKSERNRAIIRRTVDSTTYFIELTWSGKAKIRQTGRNRIQLTPSTDKWNVNVGFYQQQPADVQPDYEACLRSANKCWNEYWQKTGVVDFSECTDERAPLLERRVVLSQYLLRSQEAQSYPPAETGLTYNTWYGKFHLEMVMWHSFQYAQWGMPELLEKQLQWYKTAMPMARRIAERQGFPGVRWMKMTDPSSKEAPSDIGSFLIWQQPHVIYMAELIYRLKPSEEFLREYADMIDQTARFMAAFPTYDAEKDRYIIEGACAASEFYRQQITVNPSLELAYWHFGLSLAQKWRERLGQERVAEWDDIIAKISPLASTPDSIYLPAERGRNIPDFEKLGDVVLTKGDSLYVKGTSPEHLLAFGMLPDSRVIDQAKMQKTLVRAVENWDWEHLPSAWNFPSLAMNATRLLQPEVALRAITVNNRSEMLLPSGNNYRDQRLRTYLPGNGGLLLAISMMCAGWDGCPVENPGFPKDGKWNVRWEGLYPMP
jgi:hypothetical protein